MEVIIEACTLAGVNDNAPLECSSTQNEANQQSPDKEAIVAKKQLTTKFRLPKAKLLLFTPTGKAVPMQPESEADRVIRLAFPISHQLFRETLNPLQRARYGRSDQDESRTEGTRIQRNALGGGSTRHPLNTRKTNRLIRQSVDSEVREMRKAAA